MNYEKMINEMLNHLVKRFNDYSQLVALNYYKNAENGTLQWNRGKEDTYEDEARELADKLGRKVNYKMMESKYFAGEPEEFTIEYRAMFITY